MGKHYKLFTFALLDLYLNAAAQCGVVVRHLDEENIESVQLNTARIVTGAMHGTRIAKLYEEIGWHTSSNRGEHYKLVLIYKLVNKLAPYPLCSMIPATPDTNTSPDNTRQKFD